MRVILLCAGRGTRWEGDKRKHLIEIDGERLIDRSVRMFREAGVEDIWIVAPEGDTDYEVEGAKTYPPELEEVEIDEVLSSWKLWTDDTALVCGDTWLSRAAVNAFVEPMEKTYRFVGRRHASDITGHPWGELFGFRFRDKLKVYEAAWWLRNEYQEGRLRRVNLWEQYQVLIDEAPNPYGRQVLDEHWVEINDWSDDFDTLEELEEWRSRRRAAGLAA